MSDLKNKFGIVEFSRFRFDEKDIELRKQLFKFMTPIRSIYYDRSFGSDKDLMVCYCDKFREIEEGVMYPTYTITIKLNEESKEYELLKVEEMKDE